MNARLVCLPLLFVLLFSTIAAAEGPAFSTTVSGRGPSLDGCTVSVGNCTAGNCTVNLGGFCNNWCRINVAGDCDSGCYLNVGAVCDGGHCIVNVVSVCDRWCEVQILGVCATQGAILFATTSTSAGGAGSCFISDPTSHCAENATCFINVGGANCQYGSCYVNTGLASCHDNCFINVGGAGCYGNCFVNVAAVCRENCQVSVQQVCSLALMRRTQTQSAQFSVGASPCLARMGSFCIVGFGEGPNNYGCDLEAGGDSGIRALCRDE